MKSTEALENLYANVQPFLLRDEMKQYKNQIKKDLEVLEIIKKHIEIDYEDAEENGLNRWGFSGFDLSNCTNDEIKTIIKWINGEDK